MVESINQTVWVFNGENVIPAAVFSTLEKGEAWIAENRLTGMLTCYPLDESLYDWTVKQGHFQPKRNDQITPRFKASFTSAYTGHHHYEDGIRVA